MPHGDDFRVDIGTIAGQVPYAVEQAIERLRESIELNHRYARQVDERLAALPPALTLEEIQQELSPTGNYPLPTAGLLNTTPPVTAPGDTPSPQPDDGIPNYLDIVQANAAALGITGASTDQEVFRFMQHVVEDINNSGTVPSGLVCGYVDAPPGGDNIFTCAGETYRYARVAFSNDHIFKLLIDSDPGGARTPEWADEGFVSGLYRPATSPSSPC